MPEDDYVHPETKKVAPELQPATEAALNLRDSTQEVIGAVEESLVDSLEKLKHPPVGGGSEVLDLTPAEPPTPEEIKAMDELLEHAESHEG